MQAVVCVEPGENAVWALKICWGKQMCSRISLTEKVTGIEKTISVKEHEQVFKKRSFRPNNILRNLFLEWNGMMIDSYINAHHFLANFATQYIIKTCNIWIAILSSIPKSEFLRCDLCVLPVESVVVKPSRCVHVLLSISSLNNPLWYFPRFLESLPVTWYPQTVLHRCGQLV